jgi:release factor glutamine methyltransferase
VDVGTGCGCIVLSLAASREQGVYIALDSSGEALDLARQNAEQLGLQAKVAFAQEELSDSIDPGSIDAVVANLPYIASPACEQLPRHIREFEPREALDGGPDGLGPIRNVAADAALALKPGGYLFLEIGSDQAVAVCGLLSQNGFTDVRVEKDLAGHDRIACGRLGELDSLP